MTWFGWFISWIPYNNVFTKIFIKNKSDDLFVENIKQLNYDFENSDQNDYTNATIYINDNQLNQLNQLEKDLNDLKWIGQKIGNQLDLHNIYIDKINDKSKILIESTGNTIKKTRDFL
jgi:hypothetical protein